MADSHISWKYFAYPGYRSTYPLMGSGIVPHFRARNPAHQPDAVDAGKRSSRTWARKTRTCLQALPPLPHTKVRVPVEVVDPIGTDPVVLARIVDSVPPACQGRTLSSSQRHSVASGTRPD